MDSLPRDIWEKGACRDAPTELFYPDRDASTYPDVASEAKRYCRGTVPGGSCPVLAECLFFGLVTEDRFGIWGGMSPRERNALRRRGSLDRYTAALQHTGNPYLDLIENYLEQHAHDEEGGEEDPAEGGQPQAEGVPGRHQERVGDPGAAGPLPPTAPERP